jgi:hypothetical protein
MIQELEKQMKTAAQNLEFEKAALLRDQILELRRSRTTTRMCPSGSAIASRASAERGAQSVAACGGLAPWPQRTVALEALVKSRTNDLLPRARSGGRAAEACQRLAPVLSAHDACGVDRAPGRGLLSRRSLGARGKLECAHVGGAAHQRGGGSGTIFFAYCTARCIFCQNYPISQLGTATGRIRRDWQDDARAAAAGLPQHQSGDAQPLCAADPGRGGRGGGAGAAHPAPLQHEWL